MKDEKYLWKTEIIRDQRIVTQRLFQSLLIFLQLPLTQISLLALSNNQKKKKRKQKWESKKNSHQAKCYLLELLKKYSAKQQISSLIFLSTSWIHSTLNFLTATERQEGCLNLNTALFSLEMLNSKRLIFYSINQSNFSVSVSF